MLLTEREGSYLQTPLIYSVYRRTKYVLVECLFHFTITILSDEWLNLSFMSEFFLYIRYKEIDRR